MKSQQMSIVGHEEDSVTEYGHTAVRAFRRISSRFGRACTFVMPDGSSRSRVKSEYLIGSGDVHHSVDHYRRDFQGLMVYRENPLELETANVRCVDLIQRAVAIPADVSVIRWPVVGL